MRYLPTAAVDSEPQPRLIEAVRVVRQASVSCYGLPRIRGLRYQRITVLASDHELVVEDSPGSLTPVYPPGNVQGKRSTSPRAAQSSSTALDAYYRAAGRRLEASPRHWASARPARP